MIEASARRDPFERIEWLAVPTFLLVAWLLLGWRFPYAVVGPLGTLAAIGDGWRRGWLISSFAITLQATLIAFVISSVTGVVGGFFLGRSRFWSAVLEEPLLWIYSIPKVVLYPILVLILGLGLKSSVAFAILQGLFPPLLIVSGAVREIPPVYSKLARMQRLGSAPYFARVVVPYTLPSVAMGLRYCFCLCYIGVVVAQMFAAESGAGFELIKSISLSELPKMFAIVAVMMTISLLVNFLFALLEARARIHRPAAAHVPLEA